MSKTEVINETAEVKIGDERFEFPVITGTENEKAIDISSLRAKTGYVTMDLGFKNTGSAVSTITFLDGEKGLLHHRGYKIDDLAEKATFLEVIYLLLHEDLPTKQQLSEFEASIIANMFIPEGITKLLDALPDDTHPMGMLSILYTSLAGFYPDSTDPNAPESVEWLNICRLLAKMPALAAYILRRRKGLPYIKADPSLGYVANFLHMAFGEVNPVTLETLDTLLVLHADHEQNCSASTVRIVGSANTNLYASIGAGNSALWGPLHGGANQEVIEMLEAIISDGGDTDKYLEKAKDKNDPFRLMGFGHRVYKNFDPRARIIKRYADQVLSELQIKDPTLDVAKRLEKAALSDEYFTSRKLFPNVDFYSGIIYRAIGIPMDMFTVMFAFGRLPGWIAQWREMRQEKIPIGRPRQIYSGFTHREYVPLENRK
jgi:citrate synthase